MNDFQLSEFIKCRDDFGYFCLKYVKIIHPVHGKIPFILYAFQKKATKDFENHRFNIVKKFRQAGLTTVTAVYMLWRGMFYPDQRMLFMSKSDREAIGIGKTVAGIIDELPEWLKPTMGNNNDHEKEFKDTGSIMWFYTPAASRSKSATWLVIDEAAFIPGFEEHWKGMYPTISTGGKCIVISTVNGMGGQGAWFYENYTAAMDGKNKFHVIELHWKEHPDYNNDEWEQSTRAQLGAKGFAQEYEASFLNSGDTFIPGETTLSYEKGCLEPIKKILGEWDITPEKALKKEELPNENYVPGAMWVWESPKLGRDYIITADASDGVGNEGDYSAFIVMDRQNLKQVGEFYSNIIPPFKFAQVLSQVGILYNNALLVVENTLGPGGAVCERLVHDLNYENLYYTRNTSREKPGFTMTKMTRPICMETLQTSLLSNIADIKSIRIIRELKTFIYNKTKQKPEAQKNRHDDLIICLAMALHICDAYEKSAPVMGNPIVEQSKISFQLQGDDFKNIWKEIESNFGEINLNQNEEFLFEDFITTSRKDLYSERPGDQILKEFNW